MTCFPAGQSPGQWRCVAWRMECWYNAHMKNLLRLTLELAGRFVPLAVACAVPALLVLLDVAVFKFCCNEAGIVEPVQAVCLLLIAVLLSFAAVRFPGCRGGFLLAAGFFLTLCVRENDKWFDLVRHGCWIYPAALVTVVFCALAARSRQTIWPGLLRIARGELSPILAIGFFITVGFSRMFGMKPIWREAVGLDDYRVAKHVAEEGCELLGYAIMLTWAILFVRELVRDRRRGANSEGT